MSVPEGFAPSEQRLAAIEAHQLGLRKAVDAGLLSLEPGTAERAAAICREYRDDLEKFRNEARGLSYRQNFGDCWLGNDFGAAIQRKAQGTPTSAFELLGQAMEIVENLAQTYEAAGRAYRETDEDAAHRFRGRAP